MRKTLLAAFVFCAAITAGAAIADDKGGHDMGGMEHHHHMQAMDGDKRVKLSTHPMMKEHLKQNMRGHLKTVNETLKQLGAGDYEGAAKTLKEKLGVTEEMKKMCGMFGNDTYRDMGLALHQSADDAAKVVMEKDARKAFAALGAVTDKCVACHDNFKVE